MFLATHPAKARTDRQAHGRRTNCPMAPRGVVGLVVRTRPAVKAGPNAVCAEAQREREEAKELGGEAGRESERAKETERERER